MSSLIGIFGGTFDPIHNGHLTIATNLLQTLPFNEIRMVPCHLPVHRKLPGANEKERLAMLQLAIESVDDNRLVVDDIEIQRGGASFMIDTLLHYRKTYPQDTSLVLIMGYDAWLGFTKWQRWQEILTTAHILLIHRPNTSLPTSGLLADVLTKHQATSVQQLLNQAAGKILLQANYQLAISATEIREAINQQANLDKLLPKDVVQYIIERNLYCK